MMTRGSKDVCVILIIISLFLFGVCVRKKLVSLGITLDTHVNMIFQFTSAHTYTIKILSSFLCRETKLTHSDKFVIGGTPAMATMEVGILLLLLF